jgi:hypothetical protein
MAQGDVHVVRAPSGWRVEIEGSERAQSTHQRQSDAWEGARQIARRKKTRAYLHGRNGKIVAVTEGADQAPRKRTH